jgi:hypothetical protein
MTNLDNTSKSHLYVCAFERTMTIPLCAYGRSHSQITALGVISSSGLGPKGVF